MSNTIAVNLPDIGDFDSVEVIEVLVKVGQSLKVDDSIITLESDKASMEIPSPSDGIVKTLHIKLGDTIAQGSLLITLETNKADEANETNAPIDTAKIATPTNSHQAILVPDIGDFDTVEVIEILVNSGDDIKAEDSIITLESDKASMEIPSPQSGKVISLSIAIGDQIKQGDEILILATTQSQTTPEQPQPAKQTNDTPKSAPVVINKPVENTVVGVTPQANFHASPSMRKLARELGVDLAIVSGTGLNGRITESDIKSFVKQTLTNQGASGSSIPSVPSIDFAQFGDIETLELSRINKLSGKHLHACWLNVPHVTQFDEVNINDLEDFRQQQKAKGIKLTPLVFIMKAVAIALQNNPRFNASLAPDNQSLTLKKYINLGIAVDTPNGLMVPVVRDVINKNITQLSQDLGELSTRARAGKLSPNDLQGGSFTISSLGGIGGTQFTPIVNAPEVAILGVSRSQVKPIYNGNEFTPQLMLPLALSYDHRVIDGAQGARFITELNDLLSNIRNLL